MECIKCHRIAIKLYTEYPTFVSVLHTMCERCIQEELGNTNKYYVVFDEINETFTIYGKDKP